MPQSRLRHDLKIQYSVLTRIIPLWLSLDHSLIIFPGASSFDDLSGPGPLM